MAEAGIGRLFDADSERRELGRRASQQMEDAELEAYISGLPRPETRQSLARAASNMSEAEKQQFLASLQFGDSEFEIAVAPYLPKGTDFSATEATLLSFPKSAGVGALGVTLEGRSNRTDEPSYTGIYTGKDNERYRLEVPPNSVAAIEAINANPALYAHEYRHLKDKDVVADRNMGEAFTRIQDVLAAQTKADLKWGVEGLTDWLVANERRKGRYGSRKRIDTYFGIRRAAEDMTEEELVEQANLLFKVPVFSTMLASYDRPEAKSWRLHFEDMAKGRYVEKEDRRPWWQKLKDPKEERSYLEVPTTNLPFLDPKRVVVKPANYAHGGAVEDSMPGIMSLPLDRHSRELTQRAGRYNLGGAVTAMGGGARFPTLGPDLPREPVFTEAQLANLAMSLPPGAATADIAGAFPEYPSEGTTPSEMVTGPRSPSLMENIEEGRYLDAALQGLGGIGDAVGIVPIAGPVVGAAFKVPRGVQRMLGAASKARLAKGAEQGFDTVVYHGTGAGRIDDFSLPQTENQARQRRGLSLDEAQLMEELGGGKWPGSYYPEAADLPASGREKNWGATDSTGRPTRAVFSSTSPPTARSYTHRTSPGDFDAQAPTMYPMLVNKSEYWTIRRKAEAPNDKPMNWNQMNADYLEAVDPDGVVHSVRELFEQDTGGLKYLIDKGDSLPLFDPEKAHLFDGPDQEPGVTAKTDYLKAYFADGSLSTDHLAELGKRLGWKGLVIEDVTDFGGSLAASLTDLRQQFLEANGYPGIRNMKEATNVPQDLRDAAEEYAQKTAQAPSDVVITHDPSTLRSYYAKFEPDTRQEGQLGPLPSNYPRGSLKKKQQGDSYLSRSLGGPVATDDVTAAGRPVYEDASGMKFSEKSRTVQLRNGMWANYPSIDRDGNQIPEDAFEDFVESQRTEDGVVDFITGEILPIFSSKEAAVDAAIKRSGQLLQQN